LPKSDLWYNHEMKLHMINFNNPDTQQIATNLTLALNYELKTLIRYLEKEGN